MNPVLIDDKSLEEVISHLADNIPLETRGKCDQWMIFEIIARTAKVVFIKQRIEESKLSIRDFPEKTTDFLI